MTAVSFVLALAVAAEPASERKELDVDLYWELGALALTAGTFGIQAWIGSQEDGFPVWDSAGSFDRWVRDGIRGSTDEKRTQARTLSDRLLFGALPAGFVLVEAYDIAYDEGTFEGAALDLYTTAIGGFLAVQISQIWKRSLQRSRPEVFPVGDAEVGPGQIHSFPSGHAMNASAFAASFVTQRYLRNDENWPWYAGVFGSLAVATGIARLRSDNHWATDVAAGLAMGTAVGIAYPALTRVPRDSDGRGMMFVVGPSSATLMVQF
ncbi:MAG: phosphatase PAP2 family protein [Myxococcota bacterium]